MTQLTFAYPPLEAASGRSDFLASASNQAALGWIDRWPDWPSPALAIHGPAGSGKTHLARVWRARSQALMLAPAELDAIETVLAAPAAAPALLIDDADHAPERGLLHLHNWCCEQGATLLLLARTPPALWAVELPDLASRLRAMPAVAIAPPDDALLASLLLKLFADRQLRVSPGVIDYLITRMERSFAAAASVVSELDRRALHDHRSIKLPLVRDVLAELSPQSETPSDFGVT